MKYGNTRVKVPSVVDEVDALRDLYEKGEITKEEYTKTISTLQRERLMKIVASNGGYRLKQKFFKGKKQSLSEYKEAYEAQQMRNIRDRIGQQVIEEKVVLDEAAPLEELSD